MNPAEFEEMFLPEEKVPSDPHEHLKLLMRASLFMEDKQKHALGLEKTFYKLANEALLIEIIDVAKNCQYRRG